MKMPLEDAVNEGTFFGTFYLAWINDSDFIQCDL